MRQFFVGGRKSLLEVVDVIDNLMSDVAGQFLEVQLSTQPHLDFRLDHLGNLLDKLALMIFV